MIDFDSVIAPLDRESFLRDHWTNSFAVMKGAPGRFADLLSWDELNDILAHHRLAAPRLLLYKDGQPVDPARYVTSSLMGPQRVDSGGLAVALADGATLILTDVQEASTKLLRLMQVFQDALHTGAYANLYAAWHVQRAFDLHWDPQETIVLQLSGKKRWRVYRPTRLHPLEGEAEKPEIPSGDPVWEGVLEDGDALYIPRGWWHVVLPLNEPSLHLSVSLNPPKSIDLLAWAVAKLRDETVVRADLPVLKGKNAKAVQLQALRTALKRSLSDETLEEFLTQWEGDISHAPHVDLLTAAYQQFAAIDGATRLRLATLHKLILLPYGENFEFKANGRMWTVPRALAPALSQLRNARAFSVAELSAGLTQESDREDLKKSLAVLARSGVVLVDKQS